MPEASQVGSDLPTDHGNDSHGARFELANLLFFRLYQCANLLHKTGTKAVESEGLTTQRWAVLGALSRPESADGMAVGDLAKFLKVSRQSLAGVVKHLEDDELIGSETDPSDGRSRRIRLTARGAERWHARALPLIDDYYEQAAAGLSIEDMSHALHYFSRLLENMTDIDSHVELSTPNLNHDPRRCQ
jgi:DNA-binding MarR family transcriptional regulator